MSIGEVTTTIYSGCCLDTQGLIGLGMSQLYHGPDIERRKKQQKKVSTVDVHLGCSGIAT